MSKREDETILIECLCHGYHFVKMYIWEEEQIVYIDHIERPSMWQDRLKSAWAALRGQDVVSGELLVDPKEYKKLQSFFLNARKKAKDQS